jgi:hypothetical protein
MITRSLTKELGWDAKESCLWFEIPSKSGNVLCRIDAQCFMTSLRAKSLDEMACRLAFEKATPRIYAVAKTRVEAGHLNSLPTMLRKFVWLTDKDFKR